MLGKSSLDVLTHSFAREKTMSGSLKNVVMSFKSKSVISGFLDLSQISFKICNYARRNLVVSNIICNFAPYFGSRMKTAL